MSLILIFFLAGIFSYMGMRSSFFAFRILAGFGWVATLIFWHNNLPSRVTIGSITDTVVMLVLGLAALVCWFSTTGKEGTESQSRKNGETKISLKWFRNRATPIRRVSWREDANNYRTKSQESLEGRRTVNRRRGIRQ